MCIVVALQPYCDQIDQVEASVSTLEQTAYRLDAYCKRLGNNYIITLSLSPIYNLFSLQRINLENWKRYNISKTFFVFFALFMYFVINKFTQCHNSISVCARMIDCLQ